MYVCYAACSIYSIYIYVFVRVGLFSIQQCSVELSIVRILMLKLIVNIFKVTEYNQFIFHYG